MQVWKYEGCRTLSYYLKRRDCLQALHGTWRCVRRLLLPQS